MGAGSCISSVSCYTTSMNIKVLPLRYWMTRDRDGLLGSKNYPPAVPVFGRDGVYAIGGTCWLEVNGKAYHYPLETFKYTIRMINALHYNERQRQALHAVCQHNLATKAQRSLLYDIRCALEIRETGRRSRMGARMRFRERKRILAR